MKNSLTAALQEEARAGLRAPARPSFHQGPQDLPQAAARVQAGDRRGTFPAGHPKTTMQRRRTGPSALQGHSTTSPFRHAGICPDTGHRLLATRGPVAGLRRAGPGRAGPRGGAEEGGANGAGSRRVGPGAGPRVEVEGPRGVWKTQPRPPHTPPSTPPPRQPGLQTWTTWAEPLAVGAHQHCDPSRQRQTHRRQGGRSQHTGSPIR